MENGTTFSEVPFPHRTFFSGLKYKVMFRLFSTGILKQLFRKMASNDGCCSFGVKQSK